jgi:hypothetical protein
LLGKPWLVRSQIIYGLAEATLTTADLCGKTWSDFKAGQAQGQFEMISVAQLPRLVTAR